MEKSGRRGTFTTVVFVRRAFASYTEKVGGRLRKRAARAAPCQRQVEQQLVAAVAHEHLLAVPSRSPRR